MIPEEFIKSNLEGIAFIAPEIILTLAILILLCVGIVLPHRRHRLVFTILAVAGLAGSLFPLWKLPQPTPDLTYLSKLFVWDSLTFYSKPFFALVGIFTILLTQISGEIDNSEYSESTVLILAVTMGMLLLVASTDLLMIFLAFETMGILSYLLVGIRARDERSGEAALKYVLYGAFTSGTMLFGFSLLFGLAGSTDLSEISQQVALASQHPQDRLLLIVAILFFMAGLLFKTASFPFHFWCPDVYEGAPTPITAFLSVGPKAAGFVLFIRLFYPLFALGPETGVYQAISGLEWPSILALVSAITMTLGNLTAIHQKNLKRLLAYSSIAHAGYLLMGIVALSDLGLRSVVFLPGGLPFYESGSLWGGYYGGSGRGRRRNRFLPGPRSQGTLCLCGHGHLSFFSHRTSAFCRFCGKGLSFCCGHIKKDLLVGGGGGSQHRHLTLLLFAGHQSHVFGQAN